MRLCCPRQPVALVLRGRTLHRGEGRDTDTIPRCSEEDVPARIRHVAGELWVAEVRWRGRVSLHEQMQLLGFRDARDAQVSLCLFAQSGRNPRGNFPYMRLEAVLLTLSMLCRGTLLYVDKDYGQNFECTPISCNYGCQDFKVRIISIRQSQHSSLLKSPPPRRARATHTHAPHAGCPCLKWSQDAY